MAVKSAIAKDDLVVKNLQLGIESVVHKNLLYKILLSIPPTKFYKLKQVFGEKSINKNLTINTAFIEKSGLVFYLNKSNTILLSNNSLGFQADFGELKKIKAIDALLDERIGLDKMEEAIEKEYVEL